MVDRDPESWFILHIDDDEEDYILARQMLLQSKGHKIELDWAATYDEGCEKLTASLNGNRRPYDAVLVDYDLGGKTGIEIIRKFAADHSSPLILYTGRGNREIDLEAMQAGATMYLAKSEATPLLLERTIRYAIERKHNEQVLGNSEQRLYETLENISDGFFSINSDWQITFLNSQAARQVGRKIGEQLGKVIWEVQPGLVGSPLEAVFRRVMEERKVEQVQFNNLSLRRWFNLRVYPSLDGISVYSFDITEHKQAEQALEESLLREKESAERFKAVLEKNLDVAYRRNLQADRYDYMSPVIAQILGFSVEEMSSMDIDEILRRIHPEDLPAVRAGLERAEEIGHSKMEYRFLCKDGSYRWLADYVSITKDEDGCPLYRTGSLRDITDSKAIAQALQESEARFRDLANNISQLAWMADESGWIFWYNQRWFDYTGTELEEMQGWGWQKVHHPEHVQRVVEKVSRHFANGEVWEDTFPLRGVDGQYRWFLSRAIPIKDENGQVIRWFGTNTDINNQRQTEQALLESQERLRAHSRELEAVLDAVPAYMWITHDPKSKEMTGNRKVYELMQMPVGSNLSMSGPQAEKMRRCKEIHDGKELAVEELPVQRVAASGVPLRDYEIEMVFEDGQVVYLLGDVSPLFDHNGKPSGAVSAFIDITPRKQAQQKLKESENRFRVALASAPVTVFTTDTNLSINWMYSPFPNFKPENIVGKRFDQLLPKDSAQMLDEILYSVLETKQARKGEVALHIEGEMHYYAYFLDLLYDPSGNVSGLSCAGYDVTDRKQAEKELEVYAEELERSNRALRDFAFIASHDLQEPLRKILAFAHILDTRFSQELGPEGKDSLTRISSAASRMGEMLKGLLSYSQITIQGEAFIDVDLGKIAQEVLSDLEVRIKETRAKVELGPLPVIQGDPLQLRQLLQNLIGNALKYHRPDLPPHIVISCRKDGNNTVEIAVKDNGIGIHMKDANRIFQPFIRLHSRKDYEGTGMGLAICQQIVERHNGSISVESQAGVGSTFKIELPLRQ
jgi:PAS domain S-box-containing protein